MGFLSRIFFPQINSQRITLLYIYLHVILMFYDNFHFISAHVRAVLKNKFIMPIDPFEMS